MLKVFAAVTIEPQFVLTVLYGHLKWNGIGISLQVLNKLLLLLEDVLQFTQGGLHLLQRELVLAV